MTGLATFTLEEIASHNSAKSTWVVMNDKVYDLTKFLDEHPGGEDPILNNAGTDATEAFSDAGHSKDAQEMAQDYVIGRIVRVVADGAMPDYTLADVARHNNAASLWIVLGESVYDLTKFANEHPGGVERLLAVAGTDASKAFDEAGHLGYARGMKEIYAIGKLKK